jgi:hypothetical protein
MMVIVMWLWWCGDSDGCDGEDDSGNGNKVVA